MDPARGRGRRDRPPAGRPRLAARGALRSRPGRGRHDLHPRRRVPGSPGSLRRRIFRDQPPGGGGHRPPAAALARAGLGGPRARRHPAGLALQQPHRRVCGPVLRRLPGPGDPGPGGHRRLRNPGQPLQRGLGAGRLHPRPPGPRGDRRYGLQYLAGDRPHGGHGPAPGGVLPGPGRGRDDLRHPRPPDLVFPAQDPGPRRALQVLLRPGRRRRLGRGWRHLGARAAQRRAPQRAPGPRPDPRHGREPRWAQPGPDRPQRPGPASRHGGRPRVGRTRARGHRCGRGPRHGHAARRSHRGPRSDRHLWPARRPGSPVAGFDQIEYRPHPGRRRGRGDHEDGPGPGPGAPAPVPALRATLGRDRLARRRGPPAPDRPALAAGRASAAGRGLLVRDLGHQRPRDRRGGSRSRGSRPTPSAGCVGPAPTLHRGKPCRSRSRSRSGARPGFCAAPGGEVGARPARSGGGPGWADRLRRPRGRRRPGQPRHSRP